MREFLLAGGGLQNCLIALMVLDARPDASVTLVERDGRLGGNHTWSFHESDLPPGCERAIAPAIHRAWDTYDVAFPSFRRTVASGYRTILSHELDALVRRRLADAPAGELLLDAEIASVGADRVELADGRIVRGRVVVDARGRTTPRPDRGAGYQKFVGLELRLRRPSPDTRPLLMDARVPQVDGFRFVYVLPFAPDRFLVEDTCFSESPSLDVGAARTRVLAYAAAHGLEVDEIVRTESGVLPMPWSTRRDWSIEMPLRCGYAGGFLHPATGFSFPVAARVANHLACTTVDSPLDGWDDFVRRHRRQYRYAELLNRLAFTAYDPADRYGVFERFYRLGTPRIERFYRLELTRSDRARLLLGRPPRGFSVRRMLARPRGATPPIAGAPVPSTPQEVG